jgi:hypothetical protein
MVELQGGPKDQCPGSAPVFAGWLEVGRLASNVDQEAVLPQLLVVGQVVELLAHERTIGGQRFLPNVLQYVQEDLSHGEQGEDKHPLSRDGGGGVHHTGKSIRGLRSEEKGEKVPLVEASRGGTSRPLAVCLPGAAHQLSRGRKYNKNKIN